MEKVWVFSWDYNVKYLKYIHSDAVNVQVVGLALMTSVNIIFQ